MIGVSRTPTSRQQLVRWLGHHPRDGALRVVAPPALAEPAYRFLLDHPSTLNVVRLAGANLPLNLVCIVTAVVATLSIQRRVYRRRRRLSRESSREAKPSARL